MPSASYLSTADQPSLRRRGTGVALTILAHLLLLLLLLRLAPDQRRKPPGGGAPLSVSLLPDAGETQVRVVTVQAKQARRAAQPPPPSPSPTPPPPLPLPLPLPSANLQIIPLTRDDMAASDIARLPSHHSASDAGVTATADAGDSAPIGGATGPHGERLFNAQWYREPTNAQLAFYVSPRSPHTGWGVIACRTVAHYHVEDCVPLGETPGSGYARAIEQAAWQFLVRPPRIGGREMVGEWVSIRIDYGVTKEN